MFTRSLSARKVSLPLFISTAFALVIVVGGLFAAGAGAAPLAFSDSLRELLGSAVTSIAESDVLGGPASADLAPTNGAAVVFANTCTSAANGNWSLPATWANCGGTTPQPLDAVVIGPHTITFDVGDPTTVASLTISPATTAKNGLSVNGANGTLAVTGALTMGTTGVG